MGQFFEKVEINTPGELIYKPVKAAVWDRGENSQSVLGHMRQDQNLRNEALQVAGRPQSS
jgi:hypothetical protein